jgi:hypothetical protein
MTQATDQHLISMSLYGDKSRYTIPALRSAASFQRFYPGWKLVIFVDQSVPNLIVSQLEQHCTVIYVDSEADPNGMFWRFQAVNLPGVSTVIFRDADSDLTQRESSAVNEWLQSGLPVHIMRDHPFHDYPILGGMFGVRNTPEVKGLLANVSSISDAYGEDISSLVEHFYRHLSDSAIFTHDEFFDYSSRSNRFPRTEALGGFVGEVAEFPSVRKFALRSIRALGLLKVRLFGRFKASDTAK